jgi:hypothetical protein
MEEAKKMASVPIKINKDLGDEFWEDVKDAFFGAREKKEQWEKTLGIYKCVGCGEPAYPNKAGLADQCENCFGKKEEKSAPTPLQNCPACLREYESLDFAAGDLKVCEPCYRIHIRQQIRLYGFQCVSCNKKVSSVMVLEGRRFCHPCSYSHMLATMTPKNSAQKMKWITHANRVDGENDLAFIQQKIMEKATKGRFRYEQEDDISVATARWLKEQGFKVWTTGSTIVIGWD